MIILEVGNLSGLVAVLVAIMLGPPIVLTIVGVSIRKNNPKSSKIIFILAGLYLLIGLGICGALIS